MSAGHWDEVYGTRATEELSWFQAEPGVSFRLLSRSEPGAVVDVGAGASHLADALVGYGWDVTLLDISEAPLATDRARLGDAVRYLACDVTTWLPDQLYDAWHDRAVYAAVAAAAVRPGGLLVLGTFAPDGPEQCSGLPTCRYDGPGLAAVFADAFVLEHEEREEHVTPWGAVQPFTWVVLRRR